MKKFSPAPLHQDQSRWRNVDQKAAKETGILNAYVFSNGNRAIYFGGSVYIWVFPKIGVLQNHDF